MSESFETPPDAAVYAPVELPGCTLRAAREARGLTVGDIAQALKFSPRQIEALEADDFDALPGTTFIRGAVRSYAKFLRLDAEPLLAMLDGIAPAAPPDVRPPQNMGTAASYRGMRQVSPLVAASILLMVVAVVIGLWHSLGRPQGGAAAGSAAPTETAETVVPVAPPQATLDQPAAAVPAPAAPAPVPAAAAPSPVAPSAVSPAAASPTAATPPAAATAPAQPAAAPVAAAPSGMRQLTFSFGDKSWVEVKDASQRTIFTGEQPAGSKQKVTGRPPFQIVIGNAGKVQLQEDDHSVDLKPYIRAEVARLTIE